MKKFSLSIYNSAKYFKLFKQLFGESDDNFNKLNGYCVYLYKIEELKAIYVGLTVQPLQRDLQHITPNSKGEYDSLGTYCKKNNVPIPKMEIVKDNLTPSEASKYEEQLWHEYKNLGWFMINSERNLGRLGAINKNDGWTTEKIKRYIKNHKEIKSIDILKEYNLELYQVILNENLLDEIFKKEISENDIYDYITKHPEIHSKTALRKSNKDIFNVAKKLNLLEKIFKTRNKYTVENICQFIFEHPEIKSKSDFAKMYPAAYEAALRFNIINKLFINKKRKSKWTEETVK